MMICLWSRWILHGEADVIEMRWNTRSETVRICLSILRIHNNNKVDFGSSTPFSCLFTLKSISGMKLPFVIANATNFIFVLLQNATICNRNEECDSNEWISVIQPTTISIINISTKAILPGIFLECTYRGCQFCIGFHLVHGCSIAQ